MWYIPKQHFCLGPVSVLPPSSKQKAEVYTGFILMRLRMSFSRDVSHWKLNLQSFVLSHPSSSLNSCALKLFYQSSNTFVSTVTSGQVASQRHSRSTARGRICCSITVRCVRSGIARNWLVILVNRENSVVSCSPRRNLLNSQVKAPCNKRKGRGRNLSVSLFFCCRMLPKVVERDCILHGLYLRQGNPSSVCWGNSD